MRLEIKFVKMDEYTQTGQLPEKCCGNAGPHS